MNNDVVAITVTYNRINTLKRNIKCLIEQNSNSLTNIIIVDNNSNVESKEKLVEIAKLDKRIEILYLNENLGGAGGFEEGMKYAKNKYNSKWYWIMDDDAYPSKDCLKILLDNINICENIGFLAPIIYGITLEKFQLYHHKNINNRLQDYPVYKGGDMIKKITPIQANAFVGPLISREAVERVGYPNGQLFIYGDDTEYTYRITSSGLKAFLVKDAIINHEDPPQNSNGLSPIHWWKIYYMFRNQYIFANNYSNTKYNKIINYSKLTIIILKSIIGAIIKPSYNGFRSMRIKLLYKAIIDGIKNNDGKTINPEVYIKNINDMQDRNFKKIC